MFGVVLNICMMITSGYTIMDVSMLKVIVQENKKEWMKFDAQVPTNKGFIYYLAPDEVVFLPNDLLDDSKGILFHSKACYEECLSKDWFPIDNPEKKVYERFQPEIRELNIKIDGILLSLANRYDIQFTSKDISDGDICILADEMRNRKREISKADKLFTALAVGEYIRRKSKGSWILLKQYGKYNPYFIPAVLYPDNRQIFLILDVFDSYFENTSITLDEFSKLQYVINPGLFFESLRYSKIPEPFRIL